SGLMTQASTMTRPPAAVRAVRGPLTREALLRQGIRCPEVYGDPALLAARFWPKAAQSNDIVVVPHFFDRDLPAVEELAERAGGRIVDVQGDVDHLIKTIGAARMVISSSLHGLIIAAAFQRPIAWVEFSQSIPGDGF